MTRFKVRPTRKAANIPCATELAGLLACFANTGDLRATAEGTQGCATAARTLHACMAKGPKGGARGSGSINHLLSKLR